MKIVKLGALLSSSMLCVLVAGCGGGGSGGVASTPTPPPPAGANTNLLGPLKSESFVNDAAQGSLSVSGNTSSASAGAATATFVYNASTQSYTMTVGGAAQTFGPANIDAALTNSAETVYEIKSGNTTDSLTLTNPGTSGRFTYEYVGAAFWQSTTINGSSGNGSLYAVTYGEPTPSAAVPKTGVGTYGFDLIGAVGTGANVTGIAGQGQLAVDFATDKVVLGGTFAAPPSPLPGPQGVFSGYGTLNSTGGFTGPFALGGSGAGNGTGQITGRLYGPDAQEVGGSFYTTTGTTSPTVSTGTIIGRSETASAPATSFTALTGSQFLTAGSSRQYTSGSGTSGFGSLELGLNGAGGIAAVFAGDYTASFPLSELGGPASSIGTLFQNNASGSYTGALLINPLGQTGVEAPFDTAFVYAGMTGEQTTAGHFFDYFLIGLATPASVLPTAGSAAYAVNIDGTIANPKAGNSASEVTGTGEISVNFASGQVTTSGVLYNGAASGAAQPNNFSGTGAMTSGSTAFTTNLSVNGLAAGGSTPAIATTYTGNLQGGLFGPAATEVGALFNATGSDGSNLAGAMTGTGTGVPGAPGNPLTTLPTLISPATFVAYNSAYGGELSQLAQNSELTYDPTTKTYVIGYNSEGNSLIPALSGVILTPAGLNSANSNATFTNYGGVQFFNPGAANPVLQLSYLSFAQITQSAYSAVLSANTTFTYYNVFGLQTPSANMPTTGSATYSGVVYGNGYDPAISTGDLTLGGTGQLSANFTTGAINTTLTLNATPVAGGTTQSLGSYAFTGTTSGGTFSARNAQSGGNMSGAFYGPAATEVGAAFNINTEQVNGGSVASATNLAGVFLGKKN